VLNPDGWLTAMTLPTGMVFAEAGVAPTATTAAVIIIARAPATPTSLRMSYLVDVRIGRLSGVDDPDPTIPTESGRGGSVKG
jgi:hypothetical protein